MDYENKTKEQLVEELRELHNTIEEKNQKEMQREHVLQEKQMQLEAILDYSPALISIKDSKGTVTLVNRNFEVLEGPSPEDYIGKNVYELFP